MRTPSLRLRHLMGFAVAPISVLAAAAMISHSSYAAFSSDTRNSGNSWAAGTLTLTDDDAGSARFNVSDIVPGQTETKCITITAKSADPGVVKAYVINPVHSAQNLEDHIKITVKRGDGGGFGSCTGFVASSTIAEAVPLEYILTTHTNYASGIGEWVTTGVPTGESKTYQITWTLDTSGMTQDQVNALQGSRTGADVQWELQNT